MAALPAECLSSWLRSASRRFCHQARAQPTCIDASKRKSDCWVADRWVQLTLIYDHQISELQKTEPSWRSSQSFPWVFQEASCIFLADVLGLSLRGPGYVREFSQRIFCGFRKFLLRFPGCSRSFPRVVLKFSRSFHGAFPELSWILLGDFQ